MPYNEENLRAGLNTFTKPNFARFKDAVELYNEEVAGGISQRLAIEHALASAVTKLKDEKAKLQAARKAAGVTGTQRVVDAAQPLVNTRAKKIKTVETTEEPSSQGYTWFGSTALIGVVFGVIVGAIASILLVIFGNWLYSTWLPDATVGLIVFLDFVIAIATVLLFASIGYRIASRSDYQEASSEEIEFEEPEAFGLKTTT